MAEPVQIGILLYPNVTQLDATGPAQVLCRVPGATLHMIWKTRDPVPTDAGFSIVPTTTFADCPQLDVICVPGGGGQVDADGRSRDARLPAPAGGRGALRHLGLHRLAGAGRRRPAQGLQVGLPLGVARHAEGFRRHPGRRARRARPQPHLGRRRHRRHRFRPHRRRPSWPARKSPSRSSSCSSTIRSRRSIRARPRRPASSG